MGIKGGPRIPKDGLVLSLDAANSKSFRGEPTTNLTRNARDFTGTSYATSDEYIYLSGNLNKTYLSDVDTPVGQGATLISIDGNYGYHYLNRWGEGGTGNHYLSCYVKPLVSGINNICIAYVNAGGKATNFNLDTNEITFGANIVSQSAFIEDVKGWPGWKRIGAKIEGYSGGWVGSIGYNSLSQFQGTNGDKPLLITGVQHETGSYFTHFIDAQQSRGTTVATGGGWSDLTNSTEHGELLNGTTYDSGSLGSLSFDGVDDEVSIPWNSDSMDFSLAQSICMWLKPAVGSNSSRRNPYNQAYGGPGTITHETNGSFNYYFGTNGYDGQPYYYKGSDFTVAGNELAFISVTRDQASNVVNWYKNGSFWRTDNAAGLSATTNGTRPIRIGRGYAGAFLGDIYITLVYNRALTADEIKNIYAATRGRFGL